MEKIAAFLDGKKTYIIMVITAATGAAQALGYVVPEWVYAIEAALGIGAVRVAIAKAS